MTMKIGGQVRDEDEAQMVHDILMLSAVQQRFTRARKAKDG